MDTTTNSPAVPTVTPLGRALDTIKRLRAQLDSQRASQSLAVVGAGMRLPGQIDSLDGYWQAMAEGRDLVRAMPAARKARFAADWDQLPHKGGFLDEVMAFDAGFFGISPREARALDPQHRLLLEVAWEALENAALPPDRIGRVASGRAGLYVGITGQDYRDWQAEAPDAYWATGNGHCFAAGRIAYAMGFTGPAIAVDTACSSGLVAVHLAAQALRRGECDVAVAGGVNLILSPRSTRLIQQTRALSPDGLCKAFDARANGFTRGEGCGIVVLKRLDQAVRDGDRIHAVIRGSAVNQDGRSSGFTAPNVLAQIALIEAALADAGLAPADIGLVEAHGTGTALGDPIEMEALTAALGRKNGGARLHVGSVKTNIGHLEAAAGVAGLLKAIACCSRRAIPALVHFRTLNPRIDLGGTAIALPSALVPWPADAGRFAGVSSFGLSGTNAHMIVGPADGGEVKAGAPPAVTGFELTARTPEALRALAARFHTRLAALPAGDYAAFAYTATSGRARHAVRAQIAAADPATALAALAALASGAPCRAITLNPDARLAELPRRIVDLPHYPWQRELHAPDAPAVTDLPRRIVDLPRDPAVRRPGEAATGSRWELEAAPPAVRQHGGSATAIAGSADDALGWVHRQVAGVLGHRDASTVAADANLFELGLDSLMAADLARELSLGSGRTVTVAQIYQRPTVAGLAASLDVSTDAAAPAELAPRAARPARPRRVAFLFSCQGTQYVGMGRELYASEPVFRARIDACDAILRPVLGVSLAAVMYGDCADPDVIHQTWLTQPALVALQLALADLWQSWGVTASLVLGHSLGEIAAAIHAGVLDAAAGLRLVAQRARLMQSTAPGAMLAVAAAIAEVTAWLDGTSLDVAAINGPRAAVVAGARDQIDALAARLAALGVTARPIAVTLASHSRMMEPILGAFHDAIAGLTPRAPRVPIVANLTGRLAAPGDHDAAYWCRHLRQPVQFHASAAALRELDIDACLEIGPGSTLIDLVAAAGLSPASGGLASLRRDTAERATMLAAAQALGAPHAVGAAIAAPASPRTTGRFVRPRPVDAPSLRLIVFHHAGGSAAMYHAMAAELPAGWELLALDLPGRGTCHDEAPISDVPALLDRVLADVGPWLDAPFALFGHSLGGIVAAELARACERAGTPPVWIGVSGRVAPTIQLPTSHLGQLDDAALLAQVIALGGTPDGIADRPAHRDRFLHVLRADLALLETYQAAPDRAMLRCPVTAFGGTSDEWAPPTTLRPWARETRGEFHLRMYPGGHFYFLGAALASVTRDVVRELAPLVASRAPRAA